MPANQSPKDVQSHYARLAATYAAKANPACDRAYRDLVRAHLGNAQRVLEIGCGAVPVALDTSAPFTAGCDMSIPMLRAMTQRTMACCAADGESLPFGDDEFDGAVCINVLEHTPDPRRLTEEVARVLQPGGVFVAVTPNGRLEWLLDLLEKLHLKLPEGPHRFLTPRDLRAACPDSMHVVAYETFLAFPAGPAGFVRFVDGVVRFGLFQYFVAVKGE